MQLVITNTKRFKSAFEAVANLIKEAKIEIDQDGFRLNALDKSHITFVGLELKPSFFEEYNLEYPVEIDVDTCEMFKVLKRAKVEDVITIDTNESQLILTFEGAAKRSFELNLIDIEYEAPSAPDIEYKSCVSIPSKLLNEGLIDAELIGDKIFLILDENKFYMDTEGFAGKNKFEYIHGDAVNGSFKSVYSLSNLRKMLKANKFSDEVKIQLGNDQPVTVTLEPETEDGSVSFLLAPRIESEE